MTGLSDLVRVAPNALKQAAYGGVGSSGVMVVTDLSWQQWVTIFVCVCVCAFVALIKAHNDRRSELLKNPNYPPVNSLLEAGIGVSAALFVLFVATMLEMDFNAKIALMVVSGWGTRATLNGGSILWESVRSAAAKGIK